MNTPEPGQAHPLADLMRRSRLTDDEEAVSLLSPFPTADQPLTLPLLELRARRAFGAWSEPRRRQLAARAWELLQAEVAAVGNPEPASDEQGKAAQPGHLAPAATDRMPRAAAPVPTPAPADPQPVSALAGMRDPASLDDEQRAPILQFVADLIGQGAKVSTQKHVAEIMRKCRERFQVAFASVGDFGMQFIYTNTLQPTASPVPAVSAPEPPAGAVVNVGLRDATETQRAAITAAIVRLLQAQPDVGRKAITAHVAAELKLRPSRPLVLDLYARALTALPAELVAHRQRREETLKEAAALAGPGANGKGGSSEQTRKVRAWLRDLVAETPDMGMEAARIATADHFGMSFGADYFRQYYFTPVRKDLGIARTWGPGRPLPPRHEVRDAIPVAAPAPAPASVIVSATPEGESVRLIPDPDRPGLVRLVMDTGPITRADGLRRMAAIFAALADAA